MFNSFLFNDCFDEILKDMDFDSIKPENSKETNTYTLKLTPNKEKGYNINYKVDDKYGKLDITADGSSIDECVNNLVKNLKAETAKEKKEDDINEKLLSLEKENKELKKINATLMDRIENIKDQRDALDAENIKLQDMNDDLVISLNQITSTVNQINEWFDEI